MSAYDEILSSSNIINILEYYGLKVAKNKCICPFHSDTHPSMMVNTSKGIAKCFACGSGGNVVSFIQKYETEINHNAISTVEAMQKAKQEPDREKRFFMMGDAIKLRERAEELDAQEDKLWERVDRI